MEVQNANIINLTSRATLYGCLAKALGPPDKSLADPGFLTDLTKTVDNLGAVGLEKELESISKEIDNENVTAENLGNEYTRLFLKGGCPPYETSYSPERSFSKNNDLVDIAGFYNAFGIMHKNDAPDHIVSELEFVALLCFKEAIATANSMQNEAEICSEARRKFLSEHLGNWVSSYSMRMRNEARLGIYPAIADLTTGFVTLEAERESKGGNGS
jgi:TorA maturation chaperone TorD